METILANSPENVNEKPPSTRWGACGLTGGYIPIWCVRRYDNAATILQALCQTAQRNDDSWFADLSRICSACELPVQERIGIEGLLEDFTRHVGEDIVADLDDGKESPLFQPKAPRHKVPTKKTQPRQARRSGQKLPTPYRPKTKAVTR